jgi:pimeloyl-ACP methyl ester carboxylesterase
LAEHVAETLDRLGVTAPAHVVGSSPGGAVAMRLAVHDPARVTSPALADSAGIGREVTWMLRALDLPVRWRLLLRPDEYGARTTERSLFRHPAFATPDRIALARERARRPDAAKAMRQVARAFGSLSGVRADWRGSLLAALEALDIPTLVVRGAQDRILPATHLTNAATALPGPAPTCSPAPAICRRSNGPRSPPPRPTNSGRTGPAAAVCRVPCAVCRTRCAPARSG